MLCINIIRELSRELGDGGGIVAGRGFKYGLKREGSGRSERSRREDRGMSVMEGIERINMEGVWW